MKNLKILSMNFGRSFIPIKDKKKKEFLRNKLMEGPYDILMAQGYGIIDGVDLDNTFYNYTNAFDRIVTFSKNKLPIYENILSKKINSSVVFNGENPLAVVNVNFSNLKYVENLYNCCRIYNNLDNGYCVMSRIVAGRFPKTFDTNLFCDKFDLDDISTFVGQDTHIENNRDMANHFFISRDLEAESVHKLVGWTETLKLGEAYPVQVTLKKVLK